MSKQKPSHSKRDFLKAAAASSVTMGLGACSSSGSSSSSVPPPTSTPNILFVVVDQLRYPTVFPTNATRLNPTGNISTADQFMQAIMPNTYNGIWKNGVVFSKNYVGATACGPARAVFVTGLYTQQTWSTATIAPSLGNSPPWLDPSYPTYGKLLQAAGYETPYAGKWHLSLTDETNAPTVPVTGLAQYGFIGLTETTHVDAANLQGSYGNPQGNQPPVQSNPPKEIPKNYYQNDAFIASTAANWLKQKKKNDKPWCLTVSFQNPHDYQFFPMGTEWQKYMGAQTSLYTNSGLSPVQPYASQVTLGVSWQDNAWKDSYDFGYELPNGVPPNWESTATLMAKKPSWQTVASSYNGASFGTVDENPNRSNITDYSLSRYPGSGKTTYTGYTPPLNPNGTPYGVSYAPYSYWKRGINLYTFGMTEVDAQIGVILKALPAEVASNTIIVFTSDHGELAGAHGFISNKTCCVYEEAVRVPLVIYDPTGQFTGDTKVTRTQITSHVDLAPMLMSFAYSGTFNWMVGDYATLYGNRFNMFPLMKSANAEGRPYALFSTDECVGDQFDFVKAPDYQQNQTPFHIVSMVTKIGKVAVYSNWDVNTANISTGGAPQEFEFYDYSTPNGQLELSNTYDSSATGQLMARTLLNNFVPNEMRAPLPSSMSAAQSNAFKAIVTYYADQYADSNANDV